MKNFLSKYWKRILTLITGIFIIINIASKIATPRNVISDVAKYGPDVEASNVNLNIGSGSLASDFVASSPVSGEMTKLIIILVIGLLAAVIIADLGSKKGGGKKK